MAGLAPVAFVSAAFVSAAFVSAAFVSAAFVSASAAEMLPAPAAFAGTAAEADGASVVLVAADDARVQALDCVRGREIASLPSRAARHASIALAPPDEAAFVATGDGMLLRLRLPALETTARSPLGFEASALAVSAGDDAIVLAGGAGETPLSARDRATLAALHEYRLDDGRRASVSSIVDRSQRSRFVVAFSDLDEIWEIDYRRDAPPVLRGLVHDYRMREAIELPGRFTPRVFRVDGATRALVPGAVPHELLRIDASGALGVLNLDVRREIERPAVGVVPAPERIAAWRGRGSRGWVLAGEGASTLRVLEAAAWKLVEPIALAGEVLAIAEREDGAVLAAIRQAGGISFVRVDVESRGTRKLPAPAPAGSPPYRFVRGTGGCTALIDARNRWIAGFRPETRASGPGRGS
ncbi:MAG: hypothetical protein M9885_15700 [Burkholderiaceae bacterium]|nr:hypothetical protein [Burkholderiaceae bacterium]